jgi:predicted ATPase
MADEFRSHQWAPELIGRAAEAERLDALLDGLPDRGGSLLIRGEAGIGKSALLALVRDRARDVGFTALTTAGVETEAELAFAGLHQLLVPLMGSVKLLPASQRRAINAAFGLSDDVQADPFGVAMAANADIADLARAALTGGSGSAAGS